MKTTIYKLAVTISLPIILLLTAATAKAQTLASSIETGIQLHFLKDSLEFEENGFEFNNITLLYTGGAKIDVMVDYTAPTFINVLSSQLQTYELYANRQQIIPIRFNSLKKMPADKWHAFTITIQVTQTGQRMQRRFWIKQKPFTKWKCSLPQPAMTVRETDPSADFMVRIENTGSTQDTYEVNTEGELNVQIPKKDRQITLESGQSGLIKATILLDARGKQQVRNAEVDIYIKNSAGEKRMLIQKVTRIGHTYSQEFYKWKKMPLTVELGAQNIGSSYMSYAGALNGALDLNKGRSILLQLRSNDLLNAAGTNSSTSTIEYATPEWSVAAGSFVDFNHFLVNGNGVKLRKMSGKKDYIEASFVKGRNENVRQLDLKIEKTINKSIGLSNNSFINLDKTNGVNSYLTVGNMDWNISNATKLRIEAGAGMEDYHLGNKRTSMKGPMYGYQFESSPGHWLINSRISSYSKNFPGLNKGFQYHNHEIKFAPNPFSVSLFYQADRKIMTTPFDSIFRLLFNTDEKEYGFRTAYIRKAFSVNASLSMLNQQQDSVNSFISHMAKLSLSVNWMLGNDITFSVFSSAGSINIPEKPETGRFMAYRNIGSLQARSVGVNFLYDRGPFYYFEIKDYVRQKADFKRMQLSPFYQKQFNRFNTFLRVQLDYSREQPTNMNFLMATSQIICTSTKLNMDVAVLGMVDLTSNSRTSINFTIRKRLQAPVYKNSNSYSFTLLLFKDKNGNGLFDTNEETIKNANVMANQVWLTTNETGEIQFRNISPDPISLDMSKITNVRGWIPKQGLVQTLVPGKSQKRLVIPFKESKMIIGKLLLTTDDKSEQTMSLSGIRVTATDNQGNSFQTLTDLNGEFNLSLPAGEYIVSLNEQAFEDPFKPVEFSKAASLNNNNILEMSFEIRQKKRQINIRKSN